MSGLFDEIRAAAAEVSARARFVRVHEAGVAALAGRLRCEDAVPVVWDAETHFRGPSASLLAYVVTLDAINFGSGWFPSLRKREGRSGYYTLAMGLRDRFEAEGPWSSAELMALSAADIARVLGQHGHDPQVGELMSLQARSLNDLGLLLDGACRGSFEVLIADADGSAEALVRTLTRMPLYRDVTWYFGIEVPFYKRAQITVADLALAFGGKGPGHFRDLDALTLFADNLVPHVLRIEGVLEYDAGLAECIEAGVRLAPGSPEEVEIRAVALHAVECIAEAIRAAGAKASAREIDAVLWLRGQRPEFKARPRHRTCTPYY